MSKRNPATAPPPLTAEILSHRHGFERFVLDHADPWHREHLGRMFSRWRSWNGEHFDGRLEPPYLLLSEPSNPRRLGDCGALSGFGGRSQIQIRPSLVRGSHPHVRAGEEYAEGRGRFVDDVLLHEMIHQWQFEVIGDSEPAYHGHGPLFRDVANRIGAALGLPAVRDCKRRGTGKDLPSCSHWPHVVRPEGFYLGAVVQAGEDARQESRVVRRRHRGRKKTDDRWRAGLDLRGATPGALSEEIARLVAAVLPRVSVQDAAAMLARIDEAVLSTSPFEDVRAAPESERADLLAARIRQLEVTR